MAMEELSPSRLPGTPTYEISGLGVTRSPFNCEPTQAAPPTTMRIATSTIRLSTRRTQHRAFLGRHHLGGRAHTWVVTRRQTALARNTPGVGRPGTTIRHGSGLTSEFT